MTIHVTDSTRTRTLMRSKNLRAVLRYASKSEVQCISVDLSVNYPGDPKNGYAVTFFYYDGAQALTHWADWRVLLDWIAQRRSWRNLDRITIKHRDLAPMLRDARANRLRDKGINVVASPMALREIEAIERGDTDLSKLYAAR